MGTSVQRLLVLVIWQPAGCVGEVKANSTNPQKVYGQVSLEGSSLDWFLKSVKDSTPT